jgi:hypothetical protein
VSPRRDRLSDLGQVQARAIGRAARQDESSPLAFGRADRPEDGGRLRSLIPGRDGAGAAFGPTPRDLVLLPDPGLVGKPDL